MFLNGVQREDVENQNLRAGSLEIIQRSLRKKIKVRTSNKCLLVLGGEMYNDVKDAYADRRYKRIIIFSVVVILNLLSCTTLGILYFMIKFCCQCIFSRFFGWRELEEHSSETEPTLDSYLLSNQYVKEGWAETSPSEVNLQFKTVSQAELLSNKWKTSAKKIQRELISLNTFLFTSMEFRLQSEETKNYLQSWNSLVDVCASFCLDVVKGFQDEVAIHPEIYKLYHGEYDKLSSDIQTLRGFDWEMQEMYSELSYNCFQYTKDGCIILEDLIPPQEMIKFFKCHNKLEEMKYQIQVIISRALRCMPIPTSYIEKLPKDARKILNYDIIVSNFDKTLGKMSQRLSVSSKNKKESIKFGDVKKWIQEKEDDEELALKRAFFSQINLNYDILSSLKGESPKDEYEREKEKLVKLINQCEQIEVLWIEKKGHALSSSKKLQKMEIILQTLKSVVPTYISSLVLAKKTSTDDIANMIRIWYCEVLLGRTSVFLRSLNSVITAQQKFEDLMKR